MVPPRATTGSPNCSRRGEGRVGDPKCDGEDQRSAASQDDCDGYLIGTHLGIVVAAGHVSGSIHSARGRVEGGAVPQLMGTTYDPDPPATVLRGMLVSVAPSSPAGGEATGGGGESEANPS